MIRILYLNPTAQLGGAEYSLLDLAGSLDRTRFSPLLVCLGDGPLVAAATERNVAVVSLPLSTRVAAQSLKGTRSGALGLAAAALTAVPLLTRIKALAAGADIVHTNGNKAHVLGGVAHGGGRLVWHVRDFWRGGRVERAMGRLANARVNAVITNSTAVASHLGQLGVSKPPVHAIPNGIDANHFRPDGPIASLRREFGWPTDAPLIGIVGMLAKWKGQDVLLRAFANVVRRRPQARCLIAGDEIYVTRGQTGFGEELRQLARDLGIADRVAFAGYRTDVPSILRALDVVVHASVEPEPFGRVVAEAMACARPVVATDGGGVPEVTGPSGAAAVLVPRGDAAALAMAIEQLLDNPAQAIRLGNAGRRRVVSLFPVAAHVERIQSVYEGLIGPITNAVSIGANHPGSTN